VEHIHWLISKGRPTSLARKHILVAFVNTVAYFGTEVITTVKFLDYRSPFSWSATWQTPFNSPGAFPLLPRAKEQKLFPSVSRNGECPNKKIENLLKNLLDFRFNGDTLIIIDRHLGHGPMLYFSVGNKLARFTNAKLSTLA
jgi:hypothetical protein